MRGIWTSVFVNIHCRNKRDLIPSNMVVEEIFNLTVFLQLPEKESFVGIQN